MHSGKSTKGNESLCEPKPDASCPRLSDFPELRRLCSRLMCRPDSSFLLIRTTFPILNHYFPSQKGFAIISGKPGGYDGASEFALIVRNAIEQPEYRGLVIDHALIMFLPGKSSRDLSAIPDDQQLRGELETKIENRVCPAEERHIPHGWPFAIVIHGVGRFGFYKYDGNTPPGSRVTKYSDVDLQLPEDWYHLVDDWDMVNIVLRHMARARPPLHQEPPYPSNFYVPRLFTMATMLLLSHHPAVTKQSGSGHALHALSAFQPPPSSGPPIFQQSAASQTTAQSEELFVFINPRNLHLPDWKEPFRR